MTTTAKLDNELNRRGILKAARAAQWTPDRNGWRFPVFDINQHIVCYRWKAAPGQGGPKYTWPDGKPDAATYYAPNDLHAAVAAADGILWIVNGEPAVLTLNAAGIDNVLCWFGEGNVPTTLAADLTGLGVREARYLADNDAAGVKAAVKTRDALKDSGIAFKPFQWGDRVGDKGDANDFWIACDFDRDSFQQGLADLDALPLPESTQAAPRRYDYGHDDSETPRELIEAIGRALDAPPPKQNGWTRRNICSPLRPDNNPTCGFNWHSGVLHDFGTGESTGPRALADHFGINWRDYYPRRERRKKRRRGIDLNAAPESVTVAERVKPVTLPTFTADWTFHARYVTKSLDADLIGNIALLCLKSATGTGKTTLIRQIADWAANLGVSILYITGLKSLNRNAADRIGLEFYSDLDFSLYGVPNRLAITPNSLHKVGNTRYDIVIVDEATQVLPVFNGDTLAKDGEAAGAYEAFKRVLREAKQVIALDAHMTDLHAQMMEGISQKGAYCIENTYKGDLGNLTVHQHYSTLLKTAINKIDANEEPVVITTDSKNGYARPLYEMLSTRYGAEAVRLISGDNSGNQDSQNFIQNINDELPKLRVLITTPSLGTGIDITAPVAGVYGLFSNHALTATDFIQAIRRYRNAAASGVYIVGKQRNEVINWRDIFTRHDHNAATSATRAGVGAYADATQQALLKLHALTTAARNAQRNDALSYFVAYAQQEGYTVGYRDGTKKDIIAAMKAAREAVREADRTLTLTAQPISPAELDAMKQQPDIDITPEHLAGLTRYRIERITGEQPGDLKETYYDDLHRKQDRDRVYARHFLTRSESEIIALDRVDIERGKLLHQRGHVGQRVELLDSMTRELWGMSAHDLHNGAVPDPIPAAELKARMVSWVNAHLDRVKRLIDGRFDLSEDPARLVNRVLKSFGFALNGKQQRIPGTDQRHMVYYFDSEYSDKWAFYESLLLVAEQQRRAMDSSMSTITRNPAHNLVNIDISPPVSLDSDPQRHDGGGETHSPL